MQNRAVRFSREWAGAKSERAEKQTFWNEFFRVFGIERRSVAAFEATVHNEFGNVAAIDLFWRGKLLVEHKSLGADLKKAEGQAFDYVANLAAEGRADECPRYILVSDFEHIVLFDLDPPDSGPLFRGREHIPLHFHLQDLHRHVRAFGFMLGFDSARVGPEHPANKKAFRRMCDLHDELERGGFSGHDLERLLVRVVYCLFAEDTGMFAPDAFASFIKGETREDGSDLSARLNEFFWILDTPPAKRAATISVELAALPHVNGQLFRERLGFPTFTAKMRQALIECAGFYWAKVSPAIFGSLFQGILDDVERRAIGAHYTSESDILKVIRPLFLDELRSTFEDIKADKTPRRVEKLKAFQKRLASLRFLDPACGCGSFLIIAYRDLRLLELEVVVELLAGKPPSPDDMPKLFKVNVDQFFGIELEEWPARIAEVALWLTDHLMNVEASARLGERLERLPLAAAPQIVIGNALRLDWETILPSADCAYLLGNPPFSGQQTRSATQTEDLRAVWGDDYARWLDYVTGWYRKARDYVAASQCRAAFVSTNSITQGEQVARLWRTLLDAGIRIDFAHRTFGWTSESRGKAHVHCVIIGFSAGGRAKQKLLYEYPDINGEPVARQVEEINPYLIAAPTVLVDDRQEPLSSCLPAVAYGNKPSDGGHLIVEDSEKPLHDKIAMKYLLRYVGSEELLHDKVRWCLWLVNAPPHVLAHSAFLRDRVAKVRAFRSASTAKDTQKYASQPSRFFRIPQPDVDYIAIPRHVSEDRQWFTVRHFPPTVIASDALFTAIDPDGFLFGILSSAMFMAWLRGVGGRIKSDIRFSGLMVYNTFPLSSPTKKQREAIIAAGKEVLAVRARYPDTTFADMYDPLAIPPALVRAHQVLDRVVDHCYREQAFHSDGERFEYLIALYDAAMKPAPASVRTGLKKTPIKAGGVLAKTKTAPSPTPAATPSATDLRAAVGSTRPLPGNVAGDYRLVHPKRGRRPRKK